MSKRPADYSERQFKLVPHPKGAGFVVAEFIGAHPDKPKMVQVRRWDTADKKLGSTVTIHEQQIIGDVRPDDVRLAKIREWCEREVQEFDAAAAKKATNKQAKKAAS